MPFARLVFRLHAVERMAERTITVADVERVLQHGDLIEAYPDDTPYPSYLMFARVGQRPVHVVAADNSAAQETIVSTVYEANLQYWHPDFRTRKQP